MPPARFNEPEAVARICKLYEEGERLSTIARAVCLNKHTVKRVLQDEGLYVSSMSSATDPGYMSPLERQFACNDLLADLREHHPDGPPTYFVKRDSIPTRYASAAVVPGLATSPAALCAE